MVGMSLLPSSMSNCFEPDGQWTDETKDLVRFLFSLPKERMLRRGCSLGEERAKRLDVLLKHFDPARYRRLLEWCLADEGSKNGDKVGWEAEGVNKRVRIIFAEFHQIACRDVENGLLGSQWDGEELDDHVAAMMSRSMGAFYQLIKIANGETDRIRYWA
ncbi:hypothetical protein TeGR_g14786 [Tetraparma gracilis]|uniref:Uncharacterized protein n=1 Tax=Tetraparma gracilis TaxID=2962635 RepID=A0ABQ6MWA2_9STRA|nr:hypothetical protein TeGR_g14786 [Tetraparma gracilis]